MEEKKRIVGGGEGRGGGNRSVFNNRENRREFHILFIL